MRTALLCSAIVLVTACGDGSGPSAGGDSAALSVGRSHSCRIAADGARCWGRGVEGQLGIGSAPADAAPTLVAGGQAFVTVSAGSTHTCALDAAGAAWCWGADEYGQLGTGAPGESTCAAFACRTSPAAVATALRFTALAAGLQFTCGLAADQTVYCWGLNDQGQLGSRADATCGGIRCSATLLSAASGTKFRSITAGLAHMCGVTTDGRAVCWGYNGLPEGGTHTNASFLPDTESFGGTLRFTSLSAGGYHTCGISRSGDGYCWGIDAVGAGPTTLEADQPTLLSGAHRFKVIRSARFTACGLDDAGRAYCWGPDRAGELASGDPNFHGRYDVPTPITSALRFSSIEGGGSTFCATTDAGALYCWGSGTQGELGTGHNDSSAPVSVPGT